MDSVPNTVMLVDDDMLLRGMASRTLKHAGLAVIEVDSGEEALRLLQIERVDLMLLDVVMGGIDGYETCQRVRAMPQGQGLPVLMLTGLNDTESIQRAYDAGATDFISKPIQWLLLTHRVLYGLRAAAAAEAIRRSREGLSRAQRIAHMGSWALEPNGRMRCTDEMARILGLPPQASACASPEAYLQRVCADDRHRVAAARERICQDAMAYQLMYAIERPDGVVRTVFEQAEPVHDAQGRLTGVEGITQDIAERVESERRIRHLSLHDGLTGLPNREFFLELAHKALEQAARAAFVCAVLHVDIDGFKNVNDALGREGGDEALRLVAARLQADLRATDMSSSARADHAQVLARIGGNAFTTLLMDIGRAEHAAVVASRLLRNIGVELQVRGQTLKLSASIGIAIYPRDASAASDLVRFAEQALYESKKAGRGLQRFFDPEMNAVASARLAREADLRRAIANNELRLHLQPKVDAASRAVIGAEALVRWQHPQQGLVAPGAFIPLAEETGLILPLTDWMFEQVATLLGRWSQQGWPPMVVSVNVSAASFMAEGLAQRLAALMKHHGIAPGQLMLEVTESMLMADVDGAIARMQALREQGFSLSLDDFGTGYSSLSHVQRFPISELKIDRSFVKDVHRGGKDSALVAAIVTLARLLELHVVAEGVETEAQAMALRSLGCHLHQGYLHARPMPVEQFETTVGLPARAARTLHEHTSP